ncbi:MAG: TadE/TadG family type IV pilus assembly protein, partial [Planctomycetaceae bacterium]
MRRITSRHTNQVDRSKRSGQAQVELALFLPLLAMMLMMIFTCGSAIVSRMNVSVVARDQAWRQRYDGTEASRSVTESADNSFRHRTSMAAQSIAGNSFVASQDTDNPGKPSNSIEFGQLQLPGIDQLGQVLNGDFRTDFKDLVEGTAEQKARVFVRLVRLDDRMKVTHSLLRGSWDSVAITFEEESAHKTLFADPKFHRFDASFKLDWLRALLSQATGASGSARRMAELLREARQALAKIESEIEQRRREIERLDRQIKQLGNRIDELKAAIEGGGEEDWRIEEMSRLERTIRDIESKIKQVQAV